MTLLTFKNPNLSKGSLWSFRILLVVMAFFAGFLLSRASNPDSSSSQVTSKKPVSISSAQLIFEKLKGLTLFKGKVKALHGTVVLTADEIRAFSDNNAATAKGHVKVVDKSQSVTLTCGNLEYQDQLETMTAHDHPILTSVDSGGRSVTILGRQMELDSQNKKVVVNQNVKIEQSNSTAEAQKATFFANENKLILEDDPTVYTSSAVLSARRITTNMGVSKSFFAEGMADALFNTSGEPLTVKSKTDQIKAPVGAGTPVPGATPGHGVSTPTTLGTPGVVLTPISTVGR